MPPKTASRNDSFLGEIGRRLESKRTSKQHQPSRFAREKPLSPQANQGSNMKDKGVKVENSIRPPHLDLPLEFVKNANDEFVVQTKYSGSQKQSSKEEELVKYMSKVPGFLQRGEMLQGKSALNFGDMKLDNLIKDQGVENPVNASDMALHSTSNNLEAVTSTFLALGESLSFREGSLQPPPSSSYVTSKSGPAKPECSGTGNSSNKANNNGRAKASPLRRLLDPLLKSKVANQSSEQLDDLRMKPPIPPINVLEAERHKASATKGLLHFTVNNGLPLFKFVVEEIMRFLHPHWCHQNPEGKHMVKESVLYNVDVSKTDAAISEFKTSRELVAMVVNPDD
ncbi:Flagellar assembly factor FliW [Bienertia sinuspersici]